MKTAKKALSILLAVLLLASTMAVSFTASAVADFKLTYDANGGINPPSSQTYIHSGEKNISTYRPTREGYTFLGWSTDPYAAVPEYQPDDKIMVDGLITLYAVWGYDEYANSDSCTFRQIPIEDSDALQNGDKWFDLADFVYYMGLSGLYSEAELTEFENSTYSVNEDGTVLRVTFDGMDTDYDSNSPVYMYLVEHGILSNDGFHEIPTADSNTLAVGDYWFDWAALAADGDMTQEQADEQLQYLKFYVNADGSMLRVVQYGVRIKDVTADDDSEDFYVHLRRHTGFTTLPTADSDALAGNLWFDLANFLYYSRVIGMFTEEELAAFATATYAIKDDGTVLRVTVNGVDTDYDETSFLFLFVQEYCFYLTEGFEEIPTADSADLADGDYWFDIAAYIADAGLNPEDFYEELQVTKFYVSDGGDTLRVIQYGVRFFDYTADDGSEGYYPYLRQHSVAASTFNPIPTVDSDALQNGDKWFDLADFLICAHRLPERYSAEDVAAFEAATYAIKDDGTVLRVTVNGVDTDYDEDSLLFLFVQEHGVDLTEGFTKIPTADSADLAEGAYWFDMATYVADAGLDPAQAAEDAQLTKFYVNNDGTVLRVIQLNFQSNDFTAANNPNEGGLNLYNYLRQHINANGYTLLPNADSDALNNGDCWFDLNAMLIANTHGRDETEYIEIVQKLTKVQVYLKNDGTSMKFFWNGRVVELSPGVDDDSGWTYFVRVHGAPQFDGFTLLSTADSADLAAGAYWYDKAAYMDSLTQGMDPADEEGAFVIWMLNAIYGNSSYYLSDDGQTLKVYRNPLSTDDIGRSDAGSEGYFDFLKQHETPVEIVDSETDVVISAAVGVLPANTVLVVVPDAPVANIEIGSGSLENYNHEAYDVSLTFNGEAVQPVGNITVKLPIPAGYNKDSIVVYYVDDNGNKTDMHATVEGDYAVFTVDHFSKYVVVDTTCLHNGATGTRDARAATCKTDGYSGDTYCALCGSKIATGTVISKDTVAHTPGAAVKENVVEATTEHGGSYDEVVRCTVCGTVISSTHKTTDPLPQTDPQPSGCPWCGGQHNGNFFQKIIGWFHNIFAKIFGAKY